MNNQIKYYLRKLSLAYYNFRYSAYYPIVVPAVITVFASLVIVILILPQLQNWFSLQNEIQATTSRINVMKQNSRVLENINKASLDKDFAMLTQALPSDKDFVGIINSISTAAIESQIILGDYNFAIGSIALNNKNKKIMPESSEVIITLRLEGTINEINDFIKEIEQNLPIAEIRSINFSENKAEVNLTFYVKPLPDLDIKYTDPISPLTEAQRNTLQALRSWAAN